MKQLRQGDVMLTKIDNAPENLTPVKTDNGRVILAYGEVTGHAHAIDESCAKLFAVSGVEDKFLCVETDTEVTHEEHSAIPLEKGWYKVTRQREEDLMGEVRQVAD